MNTVACPKCKRFVILCEVMALGEAIYFDVDPVPVLVQNGTAVASGCIPHVCQGLPAIVDRTKYIPIEEVKVICKYCDEETLAIHAVFTSEDGWKCSLCIKDHAEQAAKKSRK